MREYRQGDSIRATEEGNGSPDIPKMKLLSQLADGAAAHVVQAQVGDGVVDGQVVDEGVWNASRLRAMRRRVCVGRSKRYMYMDSTGSNT